MFKLFSEGGPLFMGILTLIMLTLILLFLRAILKKKNEQQLHHAIQWLKSIGTLGLVVGVLGQLIGLFSAFAVMESFQDISTNVLAGGLKVSLITTLYGLLIYISYLLFSLILRRLQ